MILAVVSAGSEGQVESTYLQKLDLSRSAKEQYPLPLIKLMARYADDLIWANKIPHAEAVLNFTVTLTEGRTDASEFRKGKFIRVTTVNRYQTSASTSKQKITSHFTFSSFDSKYSDAA